MGAKSGGWADRKGAPEMRRSGRAVQDNFRVVTADRGVDAPHLLGGEFRQEEVRKTAPSGEFFRFIDGSLDECGGKLGAKLARKLDAERFLQSADEIGKRIEAGAVDLVRAVGVTCFHGGGMNRPVVYDKCKIF
jgi:hypothetical protein